MRECFYTRIQKIFQTIRHVSRKRLFISAILIVGIGIAGGVIYKRITAPPEYHTAQAARRTIEEEVTETGSVVVAGQSPVYSPATGVITEISVRNGQHVLEGDTLFSVQSTATEQEKKETYAQYLAALAARNSVRAASYASQATMFEKWDAFYALATSDTYEHDDGSPKTETRTLPEFHISQKEWLSAEEAYKNQSIALSQAEAALSAAYEAYRATQHAVVKAPLEGTVENVSVIAGQTVVPITAQSKPVLIIANKKTYGIDLAISESDIRKFRNGLSAQITIDAYEGSQWTGTVTRIDSIGLPENGVMKYHVFVELSHGEEVLFAGMNADVRITTEIRKNVLSVPNEAVKLYKGQRAVRIYNSANRSIEYVPVRIGIRGKTHTEILSGLKEGDRFITSLTNEQAQRKGLLGF